MSRVNLFLIGVQKAGTSWLYSLLNQHPEIFMAVEKELYFFGEEGATGPDTEREYHAHFPFDSAYRYFGDATPLYYRDPDVATEIYTYNPDAKVLAMVRDPIQRLLSQYRYRKQIGRLSENVTLDQSLDGRDPNLLRDSHYERTLPSFDEQFGPDQFKIVSLEGLRQSPTTIWGDLLSFLDLPAIPFPDPDSSPENPTGSAGFRRLYRSTVRPIKRHLPGLYRWMLRSSAVRQFKIGLIRLLGTAEPESLSPELDSRLRDEFAPTYAYLEDRGLGFDSAK